VTTAPCGSGEAPVAEIAAELGALEARVWAQLLRGLRRAEEAPEEVGALLALPRSDLASGPRRRELCALLARETALRTVLLDDPSLPAAVHRALAAVAPTAATAREEPTTTPAARSAAGEVGGMVEDEPDRMAVRGRELRRELAELRRRSDGAEARAGVAEARAEELEGARLALQDRIVELEGELARVRDEVPQAVARAERRSAARIAELEQALAAERSMLGVLRRDHDRDRATVDGLRAEVAELRERPDVSATVTSGPSRPLELPSELDPGSTAAARWLLDGATVLLVDGYNVSLALHAGHPLMEQRRWLIERLRPLAARSRSSPVVIFDGDGEGSTQRDRSGVEVRFTASGMTADDEIVFAVAATDEPVLVLTDDTELRDRVRAEGGNVLGTVHLLGAIEG